MFSWQKDLERLNIPAGEVLRLFRSLAEVQVALPGVQGQEARAFLCAFRSGQGCRLTVALHLLRSDRVAFFLNDSGVIPLSALERAIESGFDFAESMGFMLGDQDIQMLGEEDREALWDSFPLSHGGGTAVAAPPAAPAKPMVPSPSPPAAPVATALPDSVLSATRPPPPVEDGPQARQTEPGPEARVASTVKEEAGRIPVPGPEELAARRKRFRQQMGRFLASF